MGNMDSLQKNELTDSSFSHISEQRRTVWSIELQCFEEFKRICSKYNLKYFAIAGTLLGAIRHKGFIPWDDDMDVCMFREDYEKFINIARSELNEGFILQDPDVDEKYYLGHARIGKKGTTAMNELFWKHNLHIKQPIFIDIFSLDTLPNDRIKRFAHKYWHSFLYYMMSFHSTDYKPFTNNPFRKIGTVLSMIIFKFIPYKTFYKYSIRQISKYNKSKSCNTVGLIECFYNMSRFMWEKEDFKEIVEVQYETTTINVPKEYDKVLKKTYGDWHIMKRGGSLHEGLFFDPNKSYEHYWGKYNEYKHAKWDL